MSSLLNSCLRHLELLVSFNTSNPPRKTKESGILDYLESLTFIKPKIDDLGNGSFNVTLSKGSPKYLFNVHLDTVPASENWQTDPYSLKITDTKAIGLGACDIKSAAACILSVIEEGLDNYAILFSTDEEAGQSTCVKRFIESNLAYQGIIVAEPTNNKAVTCHKGIATGTMEFSGISGHSSDSRAMNDSAIHKQTNWSFKALEIAKVYENHKFESLNGLAFNLGAVQGGIKPNIIAEYAETKFGFRPLPGQDPYQIFTELNAKSVEGDSKFTSGFIAPSLPARGDSKNLKKLANNLRLEISEPVNFWTEAALFSEAGHDAIVFGPGDIRNAHQPNEFVMLKDLSIALEIYKEIIQ